MTEQLARPESRAHIQAMERSFRNVSLRLPQDVRDVLERERLSDKCSITAVVQRRIGLALADLPQDTPGRALWRRQPTKEARLTLAFRPEIAVQLEQLAAKQSSSLGDVSFNLLMNTLDVPKATLAA